MATRRANFSAFAVALCAIVSVPHTTPANGVHALAPDVVLTEADRARLDAGQTLVRLKAGKDGYVALTALVRAEITPERFLRWMTSIETLQKGKYVPEIGRFSPRPDEHDVQGLTVDADDLRDLVRCRPGDCGLKLSATEMIAFSNERNAESLTRLLRRVLVQRATAYLQQGDACAAPYSDHDDPVEPAAAFGAVLERVEFLNRSLPPYAEYLRAFPGGAEPRVQHSFLYWSKESLGMKPIISVTHFSAARFDQPHLPEVVVVAKQVYASHYKNASITVTALVADRGARYLVYINRTHVDAFGGMVGGWVRRVVERRVKAEAPAVLQDLRRRLEAGEPPA